jgi:hypothetical protein
MIPTLGFQAALPDSSTGLVPPTAGRRFLVNRSLAGKFDLRF